MGGKARIALAGQRPVPKRLLDMGCKFQFPEADPALRDLLGKDKK